MIDDKKIKEAASVASISDTEKGRVREGYVINALADHENGFREGYIEGAKWAINEFMKDLWHPNTEKPKAGKKILAYTIDGYETITYIGEGEIDSGTNWIDIVSDMAIASWCCLEDLLPKKGGENERT